MPSTPFSHNLRRKIMAAVVETGPDQVTAIVAPPDSHIDWPGVFVGVVIALAMSWLLLTFGSAVGLISVSPYTFTAETGATLTIAAAVWFALAQIYSLSVGAYIAARLRPRAEGPNGDELTFRDGVSGLTVWALSIVLGLVLAGMVTLSAARTGAEAAGAAANAARGMDAGYVVDLLFRPAAANAAEAQAQPAPAQPAPAPATTEPDATPAATQQAVQPIDENTRAIVSRIVTQALADGQINANDRTYVAQLIAERTGMTRQQAEQRIDQVIADAKAAALSAADTARKATSLIGFWIVFIMLATGLACWWAGTLGGYHRDEGTLF
jgi:hypothetical protein